jgi:hypothetical protein
MSLQQDILNLLEQELKGLWVEEDKDFLLKLAEDVALEKVLSITGPDQAQHQENLLHLAATLQGELAINEIKIEEKSLELVIRIIGAIIKAVAMSALKTNQP